MKKHSTGALTAEQRSEQDRHYETHSREVVYDYLFIGSGNASLTCATLLAHQGYRVCVLEAHDSAGGYLHSFKMHGYEFCAQVHYIWGCGPGGTVNNFLSHIGLDQEIEFNRLDEDGYDHVILPDKKRVKIPYGWEGFQRNIEQAYPATTGLDKFFEIVKTLNTELNRLPRKVRWWHYLTQGLSFRTLFQYRNATLQDVFEQCQVSKEAQAVLSAQAGDYLLPPNRLSILYYVALTAGYGSGAYHAKPNFSHYVQRLVRFLVDHAADIYFEEQVNQISLDHKKVSGVVTGSGKVFQAKHYVCGMDPQAAAKLIGWENFPRRYQHQLNYEYSTSGVVVYLGLKPGFIPSKYGLGNHNTWHCFDWDMNDMWEAGDEHAIERSWLFISTPTMHSDQQPDPGHTIELATYVPYEPFKKAAETNYREYQRLKMGIAKKMIELVVQHHVPDLEDHIDVKIVGSPTTNEDFCGAPFGNAYGFALSPEKVTSRFEPSTPFVNLHWCNASSGVPSICGTVATGMNLYMDLTGTKISSVSNAE